jgi:tRNA(fMet)-specific endonuclease VapC
MPSETPLYILDTDHVTLHQRQHEPLVRRLQSLPSSVRVAVTVITVEEQMRGRLAQLKAPGTTLTSTYQLLNLTLAYFCQLPIIPFDDKANTLFNQLRQQKIRVGTLDLRISAIALAQNAIVLTRNEQDFSLVPGLKIANWA